MGCEATDLNISDLSLIEKVLDRLVQVNPAGYIDMTQAMDIIKKRTWLEKRQKMRWTAVSVRTVG